MYLYRNPRFLLNRIARMYGRCARHAQTFYVMPMPTGNAPGKRRPVFSTLKNAGFLQVAPVAAQHFCIPNKNNQPNIKTI